MFISLLTEEEQKFFVKSALELEDVVERRCNRTKEKVNAFVHRIVGEVGDAVNELETVDISQIDRPLAKKVILMELVSLGYANLDYCEEEREYVKGLATKLGVNSEKLDQIEKWVSGFVEQIHQGAEIVNN